jgi:hypothetical protein
LPSNSLSLEEGRVLAAKLDGLSLRLALCRKIKIVAKRLVRTQDEKE